MSTPVEASTSQLPSPSVDSRVQVRQRPEDISFTGPAPRVSFLHPANGLPFLRLKAYDQTSPGMLYGIHHGTAITACQILACNKPGYLSTSQDRDATGRIDVDLDSIISESKYFYHLDSPQSEPLYEICRDFISWTFPHQEIPSAWVNETRVPAWTGAWPHDDWTAMSIVIKHRDTKCLVSHWNDSLTTAHIVGQMYQTWLYENEMDVYLPQGYDIANDPRNLFTLRRDLHLGQFDQAQFVIVPKRGQLVVHFLRDSQESAHLYHNVPFNHNDSVSHEMLYARFTWALMKIVKDMRLSPKNFKFFGQTDDGVDNGDDGMDDGGDDGSGGDRGNGGGGRERGGRGGRGGGCRGGGRKRKGKGKEPDNDPSGPYNLRARPKRLKRYANVTDPDGDQPSLDLESQELEEDLKKAARTLPFFVDPNRKADAWRYHNIDWYPGIAAVRRRKQAYLDAHPEIRAHGSNCALSDNYDSDDDRNFE